MDYPGTTLDNILLALGGVPGSAPGASAPSLLSGAGNLVVSRITSTGAAQTAFIARPTRRSALVRNTDAANSVWLGTATVTSANGFLLKAGETIPFTFTGLLQVIDDGANHAAIHVSDEY